MVTDFFELNLFTIEIGSVWFYALLFYSKLVTKLVYEIWARSDTNIGGYIMNLPF